MIPKGFYITGGEMSDAYLHVHECMENSIYRPPSLQAFKERIAPALNYRESSIADGKEAAENGDYRLEEMCRRSVIEIDAVLQLWRDRYRAALREIGNV